MIITGFVVKKDSQYFNSVSPTSRKVFVTDPKAASIISLQEEARCIAQETGGTLHRASLVIDDLPEE